MSIRLFGIKLCISVGPLTLLSILLRPSQASRHSQIHQYNDDDDRDDGHTDTQADPLLLPRRPRARHGAAELGVGLDHVVVHLLALLLNVGHERLLLHDNVLEVGEELRQLDHLPLDLLDFAVPLVDGAEGALGLAAAVGGEELWGLDVSRLYHSFD